MSENDEYVEVLNENGTKSGKLVTITEAHSKSLLHGIAAVFVFSPEGKLYVQVRNEPGYRFDHTAAGHVDKGETFAKAAAREMEEEIQLTTPLELVATDIQEDSHSKAKGHVFELYKTIAPKDWKFVANDEVAELVPMEIDEILDGMRNHPEKYTHGFTKTLEAYLKVLNV